MPSPSQNEWTAKTFGVVGVLKPAPSAGGAKPGGPPGAAAAPGGGAPPAARGDIADRISAAIDAEREPKAEYAELRAMEMEQLLATMDQLAKAKKLDIVVDNMPPGNDRVAVAALTAKASFGDQFRKLAASLGEVDKKAIKKAILARRAPTAAKTAGGDDGTPAKAKKDGEDDDEMFESDAAVGVGRSGVEVQAKLTFNSPLYGSFGTTEFTVHVGPDGKLSQLELDLTLLKKKFEDLGALTAMMDIEASLSLDASVDVNQQMRKMVFGKIQGQVQGELSARVKSVPVLKNVTFKVTASAGAGGVAVTGGIEIRIPGT